MQPFPAYSRRLLNPIICISSTEGFFSETMQDYSTQAYCRRDVLGINIPWKALQPLEGGIMMCRCPTAPSSLLNNFESHELSITQSFLWNKPCHPLISLDFPSLSSHSPNSTTGLLQFFYQMFPL